MAILTVRNSSWANGLNVEAPFAVPSQLEPMAEARTDASQISIGTPTARSKLAHRSEPIEGRFSLARQLAILGTVLGVAGPVRYARRLSLGALQPSIPILFFALVPYSGQMREQFMAAMYQPCGSTIDHGPLPLGQPAPRQYGMQLYADYTSFAGSK